MLPGWVVLISLLYAAMLFAVAWVGDRSALYRTTPWLRSAVYSLALAVYCSSWTFYGAVGTATRYGIGYLPIYLGPLLMLVFGWPIMQRMAQLAKAQSSVSIADFLGARYERSQRLAAWVALIALVAAIPYLALQYKAVTESLSILTGLNASQGTLGDPALYVAAIMALFAILFGTRQVDASEHRPGLMLAIAFESIIKLIALVAVGLFATYWLKGQSIPVVQASQKLIEQAPAVGFVGQTLLAFLAMVCLPRQFHVGIVECGDVKDIRRARWIFGGYLVLISVMVLPIAAACMAFFGSHSSIAPDSLLLALPLAQNQTVLALIVYIGGFSAATGMVIVVSVALSNMVSNDLIMPLLLRRGWLRSHKQPLALAGDGMASMVLWVRRLAIVALAIFTYGFSRSIGTSIDLASLGLMSFSAVAQFAPALLLGLYWRAVNRTAVEVGLIAGFSVWVYCLLLPNLLESTSVGQHWLTYGLWNQAWLRPHQLFGSQGWGLDAMSHGTLWSLLVNIGTVIVLSLVKGQSISAQLHAEAFLNPARQRLQNAHTRLVDSHLRVTDLQALAGRIVGEHTASKAFLSHAKSLDLAQIPDTKANKDWMHFTELLLAGAVGAASARMVLTHALQDTGMKLAAVVAVLDEAGPELRFNRDILLATLENMDQGVSVVDASMCLVAWNQRYQQLFQYPEGMLYVGRSVEDLIRHNMEAGIGLSTNTNVQQEIDKRVNFMKAGSSYVFERTLPDGQVIELRGRPLTGGGYVTSYTDITAFKTAEQSLRSINETLELRVAERTQEAERAHQARTRFLTAVSHDVLQPVHAARLFASALRESHDAADMRQLAERVDTSLRAAEELLDGILDMSRLNAGMLKPHIAHFDARAMLDALTEQYAPMAEKRGLHMALHPSTLKQAHLWVRSDPALLRRVLQNFLANALRYTRKGQIFLVAKIRADKLLLQVWDTGPGIPADHLQQIYQEFHRYEQDFDWDGKGLGLGLSICQRIANLLGHTLRAHSRLGKGSIFSISVPLANAGDEVHTNHAQLTSMEPPHKAIAAQHSLEAMVVLCLDNDPEILLGMQTLLSRWGVHTLCAANEAEALLHMQAQPHVVLADYHLHEARNGLQVLQTLQTMHPHTGFALLTADGRQALRHAASALGITLLTKPLKPAALRAFLMAHLPPRKAGNSPE